MVLGVLPVVELRTVPPRMPLTARRLALHTVRPLMVHMARLLAVPVAARVRVVLAEDIPALVVPEAERGARPPREPSPVIRRLQVGMKCMLPMVL
jgi:hypothetical protein